MTGGTILARKGKTYFLTKVAHDGFDLEDLAEHVSRQDKYYLDPKKTLVDYLRKRSENDMGDFDPLDLTTDDVDKCIYEKDLRIRDFAKALERLEKDLDKIIEEDEDMDDEHPYMQLSCSYSDYVLFVDCDSGMIALNGELWGEYKKNLSTDESSEEAVCDYKNCGKKDCCDDNKSCKKDDCEDTHACGRKDECGKGCSHDHGKDVAEQVEVMDTSGMSGSDFIFDAYQASVPGMKVCVINIVPKTYFEEFGCMFDGDMDMSKILPETFEQTSPGSFFCEGEVSEVKKQLFDLGLCEDKAFTDWYMEISGANKTDHERLMEEHKRPNQDQIDAMWADFTVPGEPDVASDFFAAIASSKK